MPLLTKQQVDAMSLKDIAAALLDKNIKFPNKWDWREYSSDAKECPMVTVWNCFMAEANVILNSGGRFRTPEDMCDLDMSCIRVGDYIVRSKFSDGKVDGFIIGESHKYLYVRDYDFAIKRVKKEALNHKVFPSREIWIGLIEQGF